MGVRSDWAGSPGDLGPAGHIDSWGRFGGEDPSSFNTQMTGFIQSGWGETRPEGTAGNFLPNGDTGVGSLGEWQDMTRDIELEDNVSGLGPLSESRFLSFVLPSDAGRAPQGAGGNSGTMPLRTSTPAHPGHGSTAGGGMGLDPELTLTAKEPRGWGRRSLVLAPRGKPASKLLPRLVQTHHHIPALTPTHPREIFSSPLRLANLSECCECIGRGSDGDWVSSKER